VPGSGPGGDIFCDFAPNPEMGAIRAVLRYRRAVPEVSLVIPVFNEEENLRPLAAEIRGVLEPAGLDYEVVWVDDGSTDASPAVLRELAAAEPRLRVVRLHRNSGQSAALDAGFRHARGGVVVTLDADLQNDPADIPRLLAELAGWDLVCGVRVRRQDDWVRRVSSRIANGVRNRLTHESITDVGCTLKAFRAELLPGIPMFTGMHRFLPTLARLQGARVKEVAVNHRPRLHGMAKYGIGNRLWRALADLFAVRWMQKRWIDRRLAEEIADWTTTPYGSPSASSARPSSLPVSSSSGSPPSAVERA
jgi:dolichol-phosphate mannosyltransferase